MREIKFRAYDGLNGEMVYSDKKQSDYGFNLDSGVVRCYAEVATVDVCGDDYMDFEYLDNIMQYIGLKDINGKEIYEGDIVKVENHNSEFRNMIGQVMYSEIDASYWVIEGTKENHFGSTISTEYNEYEVIGNIYENKDLLGA